MRFTRKFVSPLKDLKTGKQDKSLSDKVQIKGLSYITPPPLSADITGHRSK